MSVVVDASVLVAAVGDAGEAGAWAEEVISAGDLVAPASVRVEATSGLRRLERAGRLSRLESTAARADLDRLAIELFPFEPFGERVWELRENVSAYDAWYVALAEALDLPLATLDGRLERATGPTCRFRLPPAA